MNVLNDFSMAVAGEDGYALRRIPGLITCADGSILCYYECRSCLSDWALIDIGINKVASSNNLVKGLITLYNH